jgi:ATP-dependent DNA helicase PIF1
MLASFKPTQRQHYDKIMAAIESDTGKCFFLDGPGGSDKSYLYQTITHNVRAQGKSVLCVASTGIAATLTAHKQFGIPVQCHENSTSHLRLNSKEASLLRQATFLIWDESSMARKGMLSCLDRLLQDLMDNTVPFGSKCLVLGGDSR